MPGAHPGVAWVEPVETAGYSLSARQGAQKVMVKVGDLRPGKSKPVRIKRPTTRLVLLQFAGGRVTVSTELAMS